MSWQAWGVSFFERLSGFFQVGLKGNQEDNRIFLGPSVLNTVYGELQ